MSQCEGGCCTGTHVATPQPTYNRPGLPEVQYRSGTHSRFLESMLARLATRPELRKLTSRGIGDPAIALLDCWALAADITTFYGERILNEGYLGTATEPESLTHLGRLVGHKPRPAIGSSSYVAYTLDPDAHAQIPTGSQAKSVPAQGQLPQTFETSQSLTARADWNTLAVRLSDPPDTTYDSIDDLDQVTLMGSGVNLKGGDRLLFVFGEPNLSTPPATPRLRVVASATPDYGQGRTVVGLVPTVEKGLPAALLAVKSALDLALKAAPPTELEHLLKLLISLFKSPKGLSKYAAVVSIVRELDEYGAIAGAHPTAAVAAWLEGPFATLQRMMLTVQRLLANAGRHSLPETEYLRQLATSLICPPERERTITREDCTRATALVGATAIVSALRRPPSRPPTTAGSVTPDLDRLFAPESDVQLNLLAAMEPQLGATLHQAIGEQAITPPAATSAVQVLRVKARPVEPSANLAGANQLLLDGAQDGVVPGSWLVSVQIDSNGSAKTYVNRVKDAVQFTQQLSPLPTTSPAIWVPVTLVTLDGNAYAAPVSRGDNVAWERISVWAGGEDVNLADVPLTEDVGGSRIQLADMHQGLEPGRLLVISGERTDIPGTTGIKGTELTQLAGVEQRVDPATPSDVVRPTLLLATPLAYTYRRDTVSISGNVVRVTQGETRSEALGSGDATRAGQAFPLRQVSATSPLTWLPADTPLGAQDALTVSVNEVQWQEVDTLVRQGPNDADYTTTSGGDGATHVAFGDGLRGARLPTGVENVIARYRVGAGGSGNVAVGSIRQLASRPLGVNAVTNPLPATGGADADGPDEARVVTPLRSIALDRIVSVSDYADFARARAGIALASASRLYDGDRDVVHLTFAAVDDAPVDPSDALFTTLEQSLATFGDPHVPVQVAVRDLVLLVVSAGLKVLPNRSYDQVEANVRAALYDRLGFGGRQLGQPAYPSEAVVAMQSVPGVDYVDVDVFAGLPGDANPISLVGVRNQLRHARQPVGAAPARSEETVHVVLGDDGTGSPDTLTLIALRSGTTVKDLVRLNPTLTSPDLTPGSGIVTFRGVRPAQLAVLSPAVPQTLTLRRIP